MPTTQGFIPVGKPPHPPLRLVLGALFWLAACIAGAPRAAAQAHAPSLGLVAAAGDTLSPYGTRQTWTSRDKALHLTVSAAAAGAVYAAGRAGGLERRRAAVLSAVVVGTAGLLREVADRRSGEPGKYFSEKDMLWNGLGIAVGIWVSDRLFGTRSSAGASG
jgi:uncharacterized protein YfiM (DUF2279 family)